MIECNWFGVAKECSRVSEMERERAIQKVYRREIKCEARTERDSEANDINRLCRINVQNEKQKRKEKSTLVYFYVVRICSKQHPAISAHSC